jgi:hypothetical protein
LVSFDGDPLEGDRETEENLREPRAKPDERRDLRASLDPSSRAV